MGLVKTESGKMGKILGQRHKRVGPRQAAGRLKQQPGQIRGQGDFAIILEAPDHVPQMPIIKAMKGIRVPGAAIGAAFT